MQPFVDRLTIHVNDFNTRGKGMPKPKLQKQSTANECQNSRAPTRNGIVYVPQKQESKEDSMALIEESGLVAPISVVAKNIPDEHGARRTTEEGRTSRAGKTLLNGRSLRKSLGTARKRTTNAHSVSPKVPFFFPPPPPPN